MTIKKTKDASSKNKESENKPKQTNSAVADAFRSTLRWVDVNLAPLFALPLLVGLAAKGVMSMLIHVNSTASLIIAIAIAAFLGLKSVR